MKYKLVPHNSGICCDCALYENQNNPLCNKYNQKYPNCIKNYGKDNYMYIIDRSVNKNIKIL